MNSWVAFCTLAWREVFRILRIWSQTIIPPLITTSLYFAIFGNFIGAQLEQVEGVSYMLFLAPGLVMLGVITSSYANVVSSVFGAKFQKHIEELLIAPISDVTLLFAWITGGLFRAFLSAFLITSVAFFFSDFHIHSLFLSFLFVLITALFFSLAGFANALFARTFDQTLVVLEFVLRPMIYLGGVFTSLDMLPPSLRILSYFNPVFYIINGFRYSFLGFSDISPFISLVCISSLSLILVFFNLYLLKHRIGTKL